MSLTPLGKSIQSLYGEYCDGKLIVNRNYQRKLVWSLLEKQKLIDSILRNYPVPLILLAELNTGSHKGKYEIIDGMQRLNAIFDYIEHGFDLDGEFYDIAEFPRARQMADNGKFEPKTEVDFLPPTKCASILDYQLAITIYPAGSDIEITEVFGRINAQGRQLSPQEQRQAGVANNLSFLVRNISAEIRGDVSRDILPLSEMPQISIDHEKIPNGYGVKAVDTFWCKQGVLTKGQLRDSEDEQIVLDIILSVVLGEPV